ncbi:uncharacterized protein LOC143298955 [Babylonia areolata]|uniref:uncharacterized protein LOC143298955 n=1 Tax=Babylonia areolata TaxID=304850 RepID=UPI003FD6862B
MAAPPQRQDSEESVSSDDEEEFEDFLPGLEKLIDETSPLTLEQIEEQEKIIRALERQYERQQKVEANKKVIREREQFLHVHGTLGAERVIDAVMLMKAVQMLHQDMRVCVLNLNFLKRLQTRALYMFLKDSVMKQIELSENLRNMKTQVFLKIQEEDADEVDQIKMMDDLNSYAEDWPLFVITDETCKEVERIDNAVDVLTLENRRFHFWSSSSFAYGTPKAAARHRLALSRPFPPAIKQVMDMIDIDDDDLDVGVRHKAPIRRVMYPFLGLPTYTVRKNLDKLKVFLISHNKTHLERDVWDCKECGHELANYLKDAIKLGEPGLKYNDVFIVGHLEQFESKVTISNFAQSLIARDINIGQQFCRRAVRIQDILDTMNVVVVSDSISMRGVDKQIAIIIPNPRGEKMQQRVEHERQRQLERAKREREDKEIGDTIPDDATPFQNPKSADVDDEDVLYIRDFRTGDVKDGIPEYKKDDKRENENPEEGGEAAGDVRRKRKEEREEEEELSEDEEHPKPSGRRKTEDLRFSEAAHQSMLRRAINSMSRQDKELILDVLADAPSHAVLFHFAEDEYSGLTDDNSDRIH